MKADDAIRARFRGHLGAFTLDAAFETQARGFTALFGPSGCGKTTLLRCAAGLEQFADGYFAVGDDVWQDGAQFRPAHRRPIGVVFQEASLFAHLSVRRNLLYGQRRAMAQGANEEIRFDDVIELLGITHLLERSTRDLSGGERQRVAIGRALLSQPKLLLMDEPLSALDRLTKEDILPYLEKLHASLAIPVLYVTHDLSEVERLADHIVLIERGRVIAAGMLADIQSNPALPLARIPEASVSLSARIEAHDESYGLTKLGVRGATLFIPQLAGAIGETLRIRVCASDVSLARSVPTASSILNILPAQVLGHALEERNQVSVSIGLGSDGAGDKLLSRITRKSWDTLQLQAGSPVYAQIKGVALV
jgi:molybdate transport system ATP-binding protein